MEGFIGLRGNHRIMELIGINATASTFSNRPTRAGSCFKPRMAGICIGSVRLQYVSLRSKLLRLAGLESAPSAFRSSVLTPPALIDSKQHPRYPRGFQSILPQKRWCRCDSCLVQVFLHPVRVRRPCPSLQLLAVEKRAQSSALDDACLKRGKPANETLLIIAYTLIPGVGEFKACPWETQ